MGKMSAFTSASAADMDSNFANINIPILSTSGSTTSNLKTKLGDLKDSILANLGVSSNLPTANAGLHNSIYRGKSLGTSVSAAQYNAIDNGSFTDMFIGDYWTINSKVYRIAAFDYWYNNGDSACSKHHVVLVPDANLASGGMNPTNTTEGGYVGSDMYTNAESALATAKGIINTAFSGHLLSHREYLCNAVSSGYPSAGAWYDSVVDLMNEPMVYGSYIFTGVNSGTNIPALYTISKSQLPLFALRPDLICNRYDWWLRGVVSSAYFARVLNNGNASYGNASYSHGVRPAFGICKSGV